MIGKASLEHSIYLPGSILKGQVEFFLQGMLGSGEDGDEKYREKIQNSTSSELEAFPASRSPSRGEAKEIQFEQSGNSAAFDSNGPSRATISNEAEKSKQQTNDFPSKKSGQDEADEDDDDDDDDNGDKNKVEGDGKGESGGNVSNNGGFFSNWFFGGKSKSDSNPGQQKKSKLPKFPHSYKISAYAQAYGLCIADQSWIVPLNTVDLPQRKEPSNFPSLVPQRENASLIFSTEPASILNDVSLHSGQDKKCRQLPRID